MQNVRPSQNRNVEQRKKVAADTREIGEGLVRAAVDHDELVPESSGQRHVLGQRDAGDAGDCRQPRLQVLALRVTTRTGRPSQGFDG